MARTYLVDIFLVMDAFLAALAGALIGGAASTVGALIVSRRGQVRAHRVRIYDELLPRLTEYVPQHGWPARTKAQLEPDEYRDLLDPIRRSAHVIGGEDAKRVDNIHDILVRWAAVADAATTKIPDGLGGSRVTFDSASQDEYDAENTKFLEAVDAYRLWLREQLDKKI